MGKEYLYQVGEVVNETLRIVEQIRVKSGKYSQKGYIVKSIVYPTSKEYEIREAHLKNGIGCAYTTGHRVCEENSLWNITNIRENIIDVEEAKNITQHSNKKILFKCSSRNCDNTKKITVGNFIKHGYSCSNCSVGMSYPERLFTSYLNQYSIKYKYQVKFEDLKGYIFDYEIILNDKIYLVETHGNQHYLTEDRGYYNIESIQKSDNTKRKYAKDNNINYIELDCRKSDFEFIKNSINNNKHLPNINKEDEKNIVESIEKSSKYEVQEIITLYTVNKLTTYDIAKKYNLSNAVIGNILSRNGVKLRDGGNPKRMIKCVETSVTYNSIAEAVKQTGIEQSNISAVCKGRRKTAGGFHWEFVD